MTDTLKVRSNNPVLAWVTAGGVIALAGGGFTLSFAALRDLAAGSGIPENLAGLWPLIVDGFIVVASASAFALKSRGRRVTWYPWTALIVFSIISVAGNSLHAIDSAESLRVPIIVAAVVSAVPAIALLIASHLLVLMISGEPNEDAGADRAADASTGAVPAQLAEAEPVVVFQEMRTAAAGTGTKELEAALTADDPKERLTAWYRQMTVEGKKVTGPNAAEFLGVSASTAKRYLTDVRRDLETADS